MVSSKHGSGESSTDHSRKPKKFRGVRKRSWGRWVSEIREPHTQTRVWLGSFATPEMAARAYDVGLLYLRGPSAVLNFPDSPSHLPSLSRITIKSIQAAAAVVANNLASESSSKPASSIESSDIVDPGTGYSSRTGSRSSLACDDRPLSLFEQIKPQVLDHGKGENSNVRSWSTDTSDISHENAASISSSQGLKRNINDLDDKGRHQLDQILCLDQSCSVDFPLQLLDSVPSCIGVAEDHDEDQFQELVLWSHNL